MNQTASTALRLCVCYKVHHQQQGREGGCVNDRWSVIFFLSYFIYDVYLVVNDDRHRRYVGWLKEINRVGGDSDRLGIKGSIIRKERICGFKINWITKKYSFNSVWNQLHLKSLLTPRRWLWVTDSCSLSPLHNNHRHLRRVRQPTSNQPDCNGNEVVHNKEEKDWNMNL